MKYFLKIKESRWLSNSNTKMIHETDDGKKFLGPPIEISSNQTVIVEASNQPMEDGYYHIIKIVGKS